MDELTKELEFIQIELSNRESLLRLLKPGQRIEVVVRLCSVPVVQVKVEYATRPLLGKKGRAFRLDREITSEDWGLLFGYYGPGKGYDVLKWLQKNGNKPISRREIQKKLKVAYPASLSTWNQPFEEHELPYRILEVPIATEGSNANRQVKLYAVDPKASSRPRKVSTELEESDWEMIFSLPLSSWMKTFLSAMKEANNQGVKRASVGSPATMLNQLLAREDFPFRVYPHEEDKGYQVWIVS